MRLMIHGRGSRLRAATTIGLAAVTAAALGACSAPSYRYQASTANDLAFRVPRDWAMVRSGTPLGEDGNPGPTGSWLAAFDAAGRPSIDHVKATSASSPVAIVRTWVVTPDTTADTTSDGMRDKILPISDSGRAAAVIEGFPSESFVHMSSASVSTPTARGSRDVFSYDLGSGTEVFEQIALTDVKKTRVYVLLVHCNEQCFSRNRSVIDETVASFTVRRP